MAYADERLGAGRDERSRIDLRLIPELEPAVAERFLDIDRQRRRRADRQESAEIDGEIAIAKRRSERRQHGEPGAIAEFVGLNQRRGAAAAEQHDLATVDLGLQ